MSRSQKFLTSLVFGLLIFSAAANTWLTKQYVNQLKQARAEASMAIANTAFVNQAQAYAAARDQHAFVFAQQAAREQYLAQRMAQQFEAGFQRARVYVDLCHAKLDAAQVAHPTADELDAEIERRTVEAVIQQMLEQKAQEPTTNPECPEDGQPTPAPKEEPTPAPKEESSLSPEDHQKLKRAIDKAIERGPVNQRINKNNVE